MEVFMNILILQPHSANSLKNVAKRLSNVKNTLVAIRPNAFINSEKQANLSKFAQSNIDYLG